MAGYKLRVFGVSGLDTTYFVADTCCRFLISKNFKNDTLKAYIKSVDIAGNESDPSETVWFIPKLLAIDLLLDDNRRLDVDDLRAFLKQYNEFFGKSSWGK